MNYVPVIIAGLLALGGLTSLGAGVTLVIVEDGGEEDTGLTVSIYYPHELVDGGVLKPPTDLQFFSYVESADGEVQYVWIFNTTLISNEPFPMIHFSHPGTFTIRLEVSDEDGDEATDQVEITTGPYSWITDTSKWQVDPGNEFPIDEEHSGSVGYHSGTDVYLLAYPRIGPSPLRVTFNSGGYLFTSGSINHIIMDFGDGSLSYYFSTGEYIYSIPGNYTATFSVAFRTGMDDGEGNPICTYQNASVNITVLPHMEIHEEQGAYPTSALTMYSDPFGGEAPLNVDFVCFGYADTFIWDFGDGTRTFGPERVVNHTYIYPGSFTARVTLHRGLEIQTAYTIIKVTAPAVTVNSFTRIMVHPVEGIYDMDISAWTSHQALSYAWTIDGIPSGSTRDIHHDFSGEAGIHYIRLDAILNVTLSEGTYLQVERNDTEMVVVPGDHPIFVYFEPVYSTVMTYELVVFDISASGGDSPISFTWFFGDGTSTNLYNPSHSYTQPGTYTIDLYVVDADGDVGHCSHDIIVVQRSEIPG